MERENCWRCDILNRALSSDQLTTHTALIPIVTIKMFNVIQSIKYPLMWLPLCCNTTTDLAQKYLRAGYTNAT